MDVGRNVLFIRSHSSESKESDGESTLLVDRQLTRNWSAFGEDVGDFPERGGSRQLLHFGTALKVTNNQQLDFHVGVGLTTSAAVRLIGFGYSFRFCAK